MIHRIRTVGRDLHLEDGVIAFARDALNGNARKSKFVRKTQVVDRKVNEVAQPMVRDFHESSFLAVALADSSQPKVIYSL